MVVGEWWILRAHETRLKCALQWYSGMVCALGALGEERRERGDLLPLHRILEVIENLDRDDHEKFLMRNSTRGHKKYSFPHGSTTAWNKHNDEMVCAKTMHKLMKNLDKSRSGGRRARALCGSSPVSHTHTHTHTLSW